MDARRFDQDTHGQQEYGQTPANMFLEAWESYGRPEVAMMRLTAHGKEQIHEILKSPEQILRGVITIIDGKLTTFEQEGGFTALTCREPGQRFFRIMFIGHE